jgi:hypothetical protein
VGFLYIENLQGQTVSVTANFNFASSSFNLSAINITFPESTSNNQALYVYQDSTYTIAKVVSYLSYATSGLSILLFSAGYFGCKLQSLEGAAVVQLAALLVFTLDEAGPTYAGLTNLRYSLGITALS